MDIIDILMATNLANKNTQNQQTETVEQLETQINEKVSKSGDTMTGQLTVENTVEADNVETSKLTVTSETSTETAKVEPLKVRDDRVDILKTTVTQEDGTNKAESVIKAYKSDDGDVVDIHANMEIDGDIDYTGDININGTLDMRHDGRSSLFADHVKVDGAFQMNCFQIRGASDNYGDFDVIISRRDANGVVNSIAFDEYGNIEIGSETKNGQVRVGSNYTKVRATEGLSLEGNVADDVWKLCGDLNFIDPQLHNTLPDDVTEEETTWLSNTTLQNQVLELKRGNEAVEGGLTNHNHDDDYASKDSEHTHGNKAVLDGITTENIANWNNKSEFSGSYNDLADKPSIPEIDNTLTVAGKAADAKATGDKFAEVEGDIAQLAATKQDKPTIVTATATTATIQPNTTYEYGEVSSLTLTLADEVGSYEVIFESGNTATVLSLTSQKSLLWHNEPVVLPNKVYVLSVEVGTTYARAVLSYAESV